MKVGLRADASQEIGAGHVMRQVALAQNLINRGAEVFLAASISGPSWLRKYVAAQKGLAVVAVPEGNFDISIFDGLNLAGLAVDSYSIDTPGLRTLESIAQNTLCIVDGPWQNLEGKIGVSPVIDRSAPWLGETAARFDEFFAGPEFFMLREEVLAGILPEKVGKRKGGLRVVISFGGGNFDGLIRSVILILRQSEVPLSINVFSPRGAGEESAGSPGRHRVTHQSDRESFIRHATKADFVVSGLGTTTAELCYLGIPTIFIPVVDNQIENAMAAEKLGLGPVIWPSSDTFSVDLKRHVLSLISTIASGSVQHHKHQSRFGDGASLVADVLLR